MLETALGHWVDVPAKAAGCDLSMATGSWHARHCMALTATKFAIIVRSTTALPDQHGLEVCAARVGVLAYLALT